MKTTNDYYSTCAFPKPRDKKKKPLYNGWKDKPNRYCVFCNTPYAERHEVYGGANRQTSIREGFQVNLCPECHREITENITDRAQKRNMALKKFFQKKWENQNIKQGVSPERAREDWIQMIGRSYL